MDWELRSARYLAREVQERIIRPGDTVVDCTLGNGHDALFLAERIGPAGVLYGFDLQAEAVSRTAERLSALPQAPETHLICASHAELTNYVPAPVRCIVFNLGWLPGGDKRVTTLWESTRTAVCAALELLAPLGVCTICAYPGHMEGARELTELQTLLSALRPQAYNVLHQRFLNAGDGAPECFVIQRQAGS